MACNLNGRRDTAQSTLVADFTRCARLHSSRGEREHVS
jgi:hypothetical protein